MIVYSSASKYASNSRLASPWLRPGRIALGKLSMLAGNPSLGKSQITASMSAIVSGGSTWRVDCTCCERGQRRYLSLEDDPTDTIRPRLEAAGADLPRIIILESPIHYAEGSGRGSV
jgi:putative DNA primase/helicase